jgi:hypothetical protein
MLQITCTCVSEGRDAASLFIVKNHSLADGLEQKEKLSIYNVPEPALQFGRK